MEQDRKSMVIVAGMLGIKKNLSSEEMKKQIDAKLILINAHKKQPEVVHTEEEPQQPQFDPAMMSKTMVGKVREDGRKGFHPITGKPVK